MPSRRESKPGPLTTPDAAWRRILDAVKPGRAARVPLDRCGNRYLARPVRADRDVPAADRAAMDGYAVHAADTPGTLRVVGEIAAGSAARPALRAGECARIFTGANVPPDADAVIAFEDTEPAPPDAVIARIAVPRGRHIVRRGEFARRGDTLLDAGVCLDPAAIGVCAAVGCTAPWVCPAPAIAVVSTGSELRAADGPVGPQQIRDSNGPTICAALAAQGFGRAAHFRVRDDRDALRRRLAAAVRRYEVTIVSGGVSVGDYDWVPDVLRALGARIRYHGIAMKPGKPQLFATLGKDRYLFGLPGNPLSALVGLHEFVLPALRRLTGCPEAVCRPALRLPLAAPVQGRGPRRLYVPARRAPSPRGTAIAPLPTAVSADFVSAARADGVIVMPDGVTALPAGALVEFRPWRLS